MISDLKTVGFAHSNVPWDCRAIARNDNVDLSYWP